MEQSLREHDGIMAALRIRARLDLAERLENHNTATAAAILDALPALSGGADGRSPVGE
jgi:hypothetical protein